MNPIRSLTRILDGITMYRTVIYALSFIVAIAFLGTFIGAVPASPFEFVISFAVIIAVAVIVHTGAVKVTGAPGNIESSLITALIVFLVVTPAYSLGSLLILGVGSALAILLKYVVVYRKRHLFNPAALAMVLMGVTGLVGIDWWVGSRFLFPFVLIASLLVVLKVRRWELFLLYVTVSSSIVVVNAFGTSLPLDVVTRHFLSWPTVFFAAIMLTEPLGLPATRRLQQVFVVIVAILSSLSFNLGPIYATPELALLAGNLFTFIVNRPERRVLSFHSRTQVGADAYEYHFVSERPVPHEPGQYLEWTLPHEKPDARGIRRYFTIASHPGSDKVSFAVRHVENQSSFKRSHEEITEGTPLFVTHPAGDFTLRSDTSRHVWIAGGIGITPFISMMRHAKAEKKSLSAVLFNCNKTEKDRLFVEELEHAEELGVTVVDVLLEAPASNMDYEVGFLTPEILKRRVADWNTATYYISGSSGLVDAYSEMLRGMGVVRGRIVVDYFPGLA